MLNRDNTNLLSPYTHECVSITVNRYIKIGVRDVITVMRSLGTYPTKKEIESHLKTYDKKQGDDIEFSTFLSIM